MKRLEEIKRNVICDEEGIIEYIQPEEECSIKTSAGYFTPMYSVDDHGRRKLSPIKYHRNGQIKSIALQNSQTVKTALGEFEVELVTFHPDGTLNRIFPLNGKLSGYWSELNEYKMAETLTIPTYAGIVAAKPINIQFYKSGLLKSITLWPQERVVIDTPQGEIMVRKGIAFYHDGSLKSCEPAVPVTVETPLGKLTAWDPEPNGLDGGRNSLTFTPSGEVCSLATTADSVEVIDEWGLRSQFSPILKSSLCDENRFTADPLKIEFEDDMVNFKKGNRLWGKARLNSRFSIKPFTGAVSAGPLSCAG